MMGVVPNAAYRHLAGRDELLPPARTRRASSYNSDLPATFI